MSNKETFWVDYANLGANIFQVGQLSGVRRKLGELAQIEAAREERILLENELRQFIFEIEGGLERLSKYTERAPLGVFVTTSVLNDIFDEIGIEPATFQQFVDKDRAKQVRITSTMLNEGVAQKLDTQKMKEVHLRLKLLPNLSDLERLVVHLQASQDLAETEEEWQRLLSATRGKKRIWVVILVAGLVTFFCIAPIVVIFNVPEGTIYTLPEHIARTTRAFACFGGLAMLLGFFGLLGSSPKEFNKLRRERQKLQKKVIPSGKLGKLYELFGEGLSLEQYQAIRDETRAYIDLVTQNDKEGNSLPDSLFTVLLPQQLLEEAQGE